MMITACLKGIFSQAKLLRQFATWTSAGILIPSELYWKSIGTLPDFACKSSSWYFGVLQTPLELHPFSVAN